VWPRSKARGSSCLRLLSRQRRRAADRGRPRAWPLPRPLTGGQTASSSIKTRGFPVVGSGSSPMLPAGGTATVPTMVVCRNPRFDP
jgi:hypothetical protein